MYGVNRSDNRPNPLRPQPLQDGSLSQTMTGQTSAGAVAAPTAPATGEAPKVNPDDAASDAAINEYNQKILDIWKTHSDVDYDKLYNEFEAKVKSMPQQQQAPSPLIAGLASAAGERGFQAVQHASEGARQESSDRMETLLGMKQKTLQAKAEQEYQAGKLKQSLDTQSALASLEEKLQNIREQRQHRQKLELEGKKGENRVKLQQMKGDQAKSQLEVRVRQWASQHGIDEKIALARVQGIIKMGVALAGKSVTYDPFSESGWVENPTDFDATMTNLQGMVDTKLEDLLKTRPAPKANPSSTAPAPTSGGSSLEARIRAHATSKK
jgi:hypothetical protein